MSKEPKVIVRGASWCHDTVDTLAQLKSLNVPHTYIDIEKDAAAEQWVLDHNDGKLKRPTVDIDGVILSQPSDDELAAALKTKKLIV